MIKRVLRARLVALPEPKDWDVAATYTGLAWAFGAQSKCAIALQMYDKARVVQEVTMALWTAIDVRALAWMPRGLRSVAMILIAGHCGQRQPRVCQHHAQHGLCVQAEG